MPFVNLLPGNMEQTLVSTQEVNVNLQILLERAVLSQKRLDTDTMQRVRQFQGDLSKVRFQDIRKIIY